MSSSLYSSLAWLPPAPADFKARCRAAATPAELRALAGFSLDENQLNSLAKAVERVRSAGTDLKPLSAFRLGLISNATSHFAVPALIASALRHGIALECIEAEYDQGMQEALDPASAINAFKPDAVLLAFDYRGLPLRVVTGDGAAAQQVVSGALAHLQRIRDGIHANSGALCILQTLPRPAETVFGSLDPVVPGTLRALIDAVNRGIGESLAGTPDLLFDVAALAETVGLADWHDPTVWNIAKLPFAGAQLPLYAEQVCRIVAALRGKSRKALVLDLDNTLWGGVIGDDGLEGIVLGQGDGTGEAHLHVQRVALTLRDRGVVLAVSSKNEDATARLPFQKHPEMLLREEHIAVFQANWNDKAANLKAIAKELNIGTDALVFLDDNPAERTLVRQMLPEVAVPELPEDPALYARTLLAAGYFEAITYSAEDRARADFYRDNAQRVALQQQAGGDIEAYLASLQMTLTLAPFDAIGRARIAQLINKSNQYNLTTRRYTEAEVERMESDPACYTLQARLADSFGDNGMISVVIARRAGDDWELDTWLMSCRVLQRRVEHAILAQLVSAARARGIKRLLGTWLPTEKNMMVQDH
ncbi:MAG TPA: HAD-IIIC family phosphatase, partial [Nevskiaceae bacterium]|nr:HAD-IIIC family phosphatase [Nevskiaceae bacterium]